MDIREEKGGHGDDLTVLEVAVFLIVILFPPWYLPHQDACHLLIAFPLLFHSEVSWMITQVPLYYLYMLKQQPLATTHRQGHP